MENFTPGTMDGLGLGYEALSARNPRLIYAATSGFGQTGPDRMRPALDIVVQGMGGVMSITGEPGGPPVRPGLSLGDIAAGLFTAIGILAALHERERSGRGQMIDVSMLDCQIAILENAFARYFATGELPQAPRHAPPGGDALPGLPHRRRLHRHRARLRAWRTAGSSSAPSSAAPSSSTTPASRLPDLRTQHHAELEPILNEALRQKTTAEWLAEFDAIGLPCGPLNNIPEAAAHPQVQAREMLVEVEHPRIGSLTVADTPVKLSRTPGGVTGPPPALGQHTYDVLSSLLGLSQDELDDLAAAGVIVGPASDGVSLRAARGSTGSPRAEQRRQEPLTLSLSKGERSMPSEVENRLLP